MIALYYAPGACSMAAHIVMEESGEKYEPKRMDLTKGEQKTPEYMKIHPLGRVPALKLDDGTPLSENTAILPFLSASAMAERSRRRRRRPPRSSASSPPAHPANTHDRAARALHRQVGLSGLQAMGKKFFTST